MKKKNRKLRLTRETLQQLQETNMGGVAGGMPRGCGSYICTASCPESNCAETQCFCLFTETGIGCTQEVC